MKILLAEDSGMIRLLLQRVLTNEGYEVVFAENGEQALAILESPESPPLALLDWMMPGLDGLEVCRRVRAAAREPYVYIILLTGKDLQEDLVRGLAAGADDYLTKPFDNAELQARIRAGRRIVDQQGELIAAREALREQATTDPLTAIANRGTLLEGLSRELDRSTRLGAPCAVLFVDLDHFKRVNDTHGHSGGDSVLRQAAAAMRSILRPYDLVGRYGGEEFVVVLPGCDAAGARMAAERVRASVAAMSVLVGGKNVPVTCSVGVAVAAAGGGRDRDALLAAADRALYQAKGAGRNRVVVADGDEATAVPAVATTPGATRAPARITAPVVKAPAPRRARKA
jgi:two-component system cell cycle response regulator